MRIMREHLRTSRCGRTASKSGRRMNRIKDTLILWVVSIYSFYIPDTMTQAILKPTQIHKWLINSVSDTP